MPHAVWPDIESNWTRLRGYQRSWVRPDLFAGLGVAAYLVPQVMAYATLAGLSPVVGLWASLAPLCLYAIAGTSRLLSVGPESTTAIMTAAAIAPLAAGDPGTYLAMASLCALVVGLICLAAGLLRVGFIASILSRPVLIGYLAGVAVIMIAGQLGKLLGVRINADQPLLQIAEAIGRTGSANPVTAALGISVVLILFLGTRFAPRLPWPLLAVLAATAATVIGDLEQYGVKVVGVIPQGLPPFSLPSQLDSILPILTAAAGISVVAFTDNVLTARAFCKPEEEIDPDAELRALGMANLGSGLTSGFPVSSSGSRTALAVVSGARSPAYGLITAAAVVSVLIFAGPALAHFPMAALGGLVVFAAFKIVELSEFKWLWHFRRSEFWLGIAAFASVLVLDLLVGVAAAVALSALAMMARVARPHAASLGIVSGLAGMHDIDEYEASEIAGLVVFRYDSPLFFANAEDFRMRVLEAVVAHEANGNKVKRVLLNCEANVDVDSTAVASMNSLFHELNERGIQVTLARVHVELFNLLQRAGILDLVGRENIFPTLPTAVADFLNPKPPEQDSGA